MNSDPLLLLSLASGALVLVGAVLVAAGWRRRPVPLAAAIAQLDGVHARAPHASDERGWDDRLGAWAQDVARISVRPGLARQLRLQGRSAREFATDKVIYAVLGLVTPAIVAGACSLMLGWSPLIPAGVGLIGAVVGFFVPDLTLQRHSRTVSSDAAEALYTFFDLVTLERLANLSATQALTSAAGLSDAELFAQIRDALERSRLEQRPPYARLSALGEELGLPELTDLADVMRLDESGAALSGTLRARVRELRDAHLTRERIAASSVSERMTVWMTIPSLVFALIFLVPPLLRLLH